MTDRECYDILRELAEITRTHPRIFADAEELTESLERGQCALAAFIRIERSMKLVETLP